MTGATSGEGDPGMSAAALSIFRSDCCCCCGHGVPVDLLIQYAREIPKVELHVHLEGTLEWELALEIGKRNNISLVDTCGRASASVAEVTSIVKGDDCSQESNAVCAKRGNDFRDLDSFLCEYMKREKVLRGREDFREVALTYLEAAHKDNVRHVEFFFDLQSHTKRLAAADVIEGLYDGCLEAERRWGITSRRILCFVRNLPVEEHITCLEQVERFLPIIDGVGLASSEQGNENYKFKNAFDLAAKKGLQCVAHAGEEGPATNIAEALMHNHAVRIDHGVAAVEDPALLKFLIANQVPLTVCPLSNVCLGVCRALEEHPLLKCAPRCGVTGGQSGTQNEVGKQGVCQKDIPCVSAQEQREPQLNCDYARETEKQRKQLRMTQLIKLKAAEACGEKSWLPCSGTSLVTSRRANLMGHPGAFGDEAALEQSKEEAPTQTAVVSGTDFFSDELSQGPELTKIRRHETELLPLGSCTVTGSRVGVQVVDLIEQGLQVTINSDDPAYFAGGVYDNFRAVIETNRWSERQTKSGEATRAARDASTGVEVPSLGQQPLLQESLHWRIDTIKTVVLNSVYAAFLPLKVKTKLAEEIELFDAAFRREHHIV